MRIGSSDWHHIWYTVKNLIVLWTLLIDFLFKIYDTFLYWISNKNLWSSLYSKWRYHSDVEGVKNSQSLILMTNLTYSVTNDQTHHYPKNNNNSRS